MKLYTTRLAPNPRRVAMFLAEKGIELERIEIPLISMEHKSSAFRARSPLAQVPVLEFDDGACLTESRAICSYFEAIQPAPNLMGEGAREAAFVEMWDRRMELSLLLPIAHAVRHGHPGFEAMETPQFPEYAKTCLIRAKDVAQWLDSELATRPYIAGERFTIADITALAGFDFGRLAKFKPWDELEHLNAWRNRVAARPSANAQ